MIKLRASTLDGIVVAIVEVMGIVLLEQYILLLLPTSITATTTTTITTTTTTTTTAIRAQLFWIGSVNSHCTRIKLLNDRTSKVCIVDS